MPAPISMVRLSSCGSSRRLLRQMVVFTWNRKPCFTTSSAAAIVSSKVPSMPRNESWVTAVAPSSESENALTPASRTEASRSSVSNGVTDGDSAIGSPIDVP